MASERVHRYRLAVTQRQIVEIDFGLELAKPLRSFGVDVNASPQSLAGWTVKTRPHHLHRIEELRSELAASIFSPTTYTNQASALGRAVERSGLLQPETIIRDAHLNLLDLPDTLAAQQQFTDTKTKGVYIKAGAGAFVGHLIVGPDVSLGNQLSAHVQVHTWLSDEQLHDDQVVLSAKGEPGKRLGDSWLKPKPLVRIEQTAAGLQVYVR